jgi:hypothetical protein
MKSKGNKFTSEQIALFIRIRFTAPYTKDTIKYTICYTLKYTHFVFFTKLETIPKSIDESKIDIPLGVV